MSVNVFDFSWDYLDRPRKDRWEAFQHADEQGHGFDRNILMDALGLDCEALADLFRHLPPEKRIQAAKAHAKSLGLSLSAPALLDALSGRRW